MPWSISAATAQDYEDWRAAGNTGWGWDEVLAAYKAMEDYAAGDPALRGRGGPLTITDLGDQAHPLCKPYLKAGGGGGPAVHAGLQRRRARRASGSTSSPSRAAQRNSAARAFLRPAMKRKNLRGRDAMRRRRASLFEGRRAVGVAYVQRGQTRWRRGRAR